MANTRRTRLLALALRRRLQCAPKHVISMKMMLAIYQRRRHYIWYFIYARRGLSRQRSYFGSRPLAMPPMMDTWPRPR